MFAPERMLETNEWLKTCGLNVMNCPDEHIPHFSINFALHEPDRILVERLRQNDDALSYKEREQAKYLQGVRAKATIDVMALCDLASQNVEVCNVQNSIKVKDSTAKECHMSCYNSDYSVLTAELVLKT